MNKTAAGGSLRLALIALLTAFLAFLQPEACRAAAWDALVLCGRQLLPALFPFLIVSSLIVSSGTAAALGFFLRPVARLLGQPKSAAGVLLIGWLGGFAPAASAVGGLYRRGELGAGQAARLLPACICSGPSFVILACGLHMLGSETLGLLLFLSQTAACLVCGLLARLLGAQQRERSHPKGCLALGGGQVGAQIHPSAVLPAAQYAAPSEAPTVSPHAAPHTGQPDARCAQPSAPPEEPSLYRAVSDSSMVFLRLCGFVVYFRFLAGGMAAFLPAPYACIPTMLCEVSSGCAAAAALGPNAAYWCCAVLSLQSCSVLMQVRAILPKEISMRPLLAFRALHLPLSLGFLRLLLAALPAQTVYSSLAPRVIAIARCPLDVAFWLFCGCCCLAVQLCRTLQRRENSV